MRQRFSVRLSCIDRPGIVAALGTGLFSAGFNIFDAQQFNDADTGLFFVRIICEREEPAHIADVRKALASAVDTFNIDLTVYATTVPKKVMIMVSNHDHCLADLLYRWRTEDLDMDLCAIVSNHPRDIYRHLDFGDVPFHYLPVTPATKAEQEAQILKLVDDAGVELVVLARYMQILSDSMTRSLEGRCINIHHSFLPGFKGAKPYHQAYKRGVKIIGATAHYVTSDLDEGPIIEQEIERISHRDEPAQLVRKGRDIERRVLAKAVRYHLEDRVILNGNKTVVFQE